MPQYIRWNESGRRTGPLCKCGSFYSSYHIYRGIDVGGRYMATSPLHAIHQALSFCGWVLRRVDVQLNFGTGGLGDYRSIVSKCLKKRHVDVVRLC